MSSLRACGLGGPGKVLISGTMALAVIIAAALLTRRVCAGCHGRNGSILNLTVLMGLQKVSYRHIRNGSRCHSWHGNCDLALWLGAGTGSPSLFCKIDTWGTHLSGIGEASSGTVNRSRVFILGKEAAVQ